MRSLLTVFQALWSFIVGMWVTLLNALRRPVTFQYPERYYVPLEGFRGHPALTIDPETGKTKCTACLNCAKACPLGIIEIEVGVREDKKRYPIQFKVDLGRCMVCNLCVEACPFDSLVMSPNYELAEYRRENLVYDLEKLKLPREGFDAARLDATTHKVGADGVIADKVGAGGAGAAGPSADGASASGGGPQ